jgi:hypothetical protein
MFGNFLPRCYCKSSHQFYGLEKHDEQSYITDTSGDSESVVSKFYRPHEPLWKSLVILTPALRAKNYILFFVYSDTDLDFIWHFLQK